MDKADRKAIRKLAGKLGGGFCLATVYHGGILAAPFIIFAWFSAPQIQAQAVMIAVAAAAVILWICTWDYVRRNLRRGSEPFCSVWMKVMPVTAPPRPEGDDRPQEPSFLPAVRALYFIQVTSLALAAAAGAAAAAALGDSFWFVLAVPAWAMTHDAQLAWLLRRRVQADPSLAGLPAAGLALLERKSKAGFRAQLRDLWYVAKDFCLWAWVIGPVWSLVFFIGLGTIPRPADPAVAAFFAAVPATGDGFYALAGLDAPAGVADFAAWGREKVARIRPEDAPAPHKPLQLAGPGGFDHFRICTEPKPDEASLVPPPPPPVRPQAPPPPKPGEFPHIAPRCAYLEEWPRVLDANAAMLRRYESLFRFASFAAPPAVAGRAVPGALLLDLSRLESIAYVYRARRGQPEAALQAWLDNARFLKKLVEKPASLVDYAVASSAYGVLFNYLPYILDRQPGLAARYGAEIAATMPNGTPAAATRAYKNAWDADTRAQVSIMEGIFAGYVRNAAESGRLLPRLYTQWALGNGAFAGIARARLYALRQRVHAALDEPDFARREQLLEAISEEDGGGSSVLFTQLGDLGSLMQSGMINVLAGSAAKGIALFDPDGRFADRNRARLLHVFARAEGAWPDGMDAFLERKAQEDPLFREIRSGAPFTWDAKKSAICFVNKTQWSSDPVCVDTPPLLGNAAQAKNYKAPE